MPSQRSNIFLIKMVIFALIITAIPLPQTFLEFSPFWMLLFFSYRLVYFSNDAPFFLALLLGLLIDILQGDILGQNALALILSSAFINNIKVSFYSSNLSTQQIYILVAGSIYLSVFLLIHFLTQEGIFSYYLLLAPVSTAMFWPVIKWLLSKYGH